MRSASVCGHVWIVHVPPKMAGHKEITLADRVAAVPEAEMRRTTLRYLDLAIRVKILCEQGSRAGLPVALLARRPGGTIASFM